LRQIDLFPLIELGDRRLEVRVDGCARSSSQHAELMDELRTLRQARRIEHESLPAMLRRVTDIERHLHLVEIPTMPLLSRRRPLDG
jgi:hypothetical protein